MFRRSILLIAPVLVVALTAVAGASTQAATRLPEALAGAAYLQTTQQADGGFGPLGQTLDAVYALRSTGIDPRTVSQGDKTPVDYLAAHAGEAAASPGLAAKAALAALALGLDPRSTSGVDFVAAIEAGRNTASARYGEDAFTQSVAILGIACSGNPVLPQAVSALKGDRTEEGGWGFGGFADPDTTAIAVQALLGAGVPNDDPALAAGLAYLRASQLPDGGWGFGEANASSTAFVVQALIAAGDDVDAGAYRKDGVGPLDYLVSQQGADGSFAGFDRAFATNQAVPALAGRTFCNAPLTPIRAEETPTATPPATATPSATASPPTPAPPKTGNGAAGRGRSVPTALLAGMALVLAGTAGLAAATRR